MTDFQKQHRMRVLVTGGSGMVGRYIQKHIERYNDRETTSQWWFLGSQDCDLTDLSKTREMFQRIQPTHVIHLAANVGGLFKNLSQPVQMFESNLRMNMNVVQCCHESGVQRAIFCLSSCVFPAEPIRSPMCEEDIMAGPPHYSNASYAYAKRMLYQQCQAYNQQYGRQYICMSPVNLFGKYDNFHLEDSHVIPGILHKLHLAAQRGDETLTLPGNGQAERQFLYAGDFARMILCVLFQDKVKHTHYLCTGDLETNIRDIALRIETMFREETKYCLCADEHRNILPIYRRISSIQFRDKAELSKDNGIQRKTISNARFREEFPEFRTSDFDWKLIRVVRWFLREYPNVRK